MPQYLYIHIPFCIRKCIYCDFLSFAYDESLAKRYVDALCKELELKKDRAITLKTVYIGGGTPSVLPEECFVQLFKCLQENFKYYPIEITVEANPGTLDESKLKALISLGINRMSLGIQSFNDNELKTLGRIHTSEEGIKAIKMIKNAGLRNFSIDLMYGIPGQTIKTWKESISRTVDFFPAHISSYELTPEKGTPLYELIEPAPPLAYPLAKGGHRGVIDLEKGKFSSEIKMPDEELVLDMYNNAIDYFLENGYEHYEISNFALPGHRCIHNLNYWDRGEYAGAGVGAYSFVKNIRFRNTDDLNRYIHDLKEGRLPVIDSSEIKQEDAIKEFIFLGLRKTDGLSLLKAKKLGIDIIVASKKLAEEGYIKMEDDYLRLTRKGIVISNEIIVKIFENLRLG